MTPRLQPRAAKSISHRLFHIGNSGNLMHKSAANSNGCNYSPRSVSARFGSDRKAYVTLADPQPDYVGKLSVAALRRELAIFVAGCRAERSNLRVDSDFSLNAYDDISRGHKMLATDTDSFQFSCTGCGGCCRSYSKNIMLDPHDVFLVSRSPKFDIPSHVDESAHTTTPNHTTTDPASHQRGGRKNRHTRRRQASPVTPEAHKTREQLGRTRRLMLLWGESFERRSGVFSESGLRGSVPLLYLKPRVVSREETSGPVDDLVRKHSAHSEDAVVEVLNSQKENGVSPLSDENSSAVGVSAEAAADDNVICHFAVQVPVPTAPQNAPEHSDKQLGDQFISDKGWKCSLGASHMPSSCALYPLGEFATVTTDARGDSVISDVTGCAKGESALFESSETDSITNGADEVADRQISNNRGISLSNNETREPDCDGEAKSIAGKAGAQQSFYTVDTQFCEGVQNVTQLLRTQTDRPVSDDRDQIGVLSTKKIMRREEHTHLSDYLGRNRTLDRRKEWDWFRSSLAHFAQLDDRYMEIVLSPSIEGTEVVHTNKGERNRHTGTQEPPDGTGPQPGISKPRLHSIRDALDITEPGGEQALSSEELENREVLESLMAQFQGAVQDVLANAWYDFDSYEHIASDTELGGHTTTPDTANRCRPDTTNRQNGLQDAEWVATRAKILARTKAVSHLLRHGLQSLDRLREHHRIAYNAVVSTARAQQHSNTISRGQPKKKNGKAKKTRRKAHVNEHAQPSLSRYMPVEEVANELDDILGRLSALP